MKKTYLIRHFFTISGALLLVFIMNGCDWFSSDRETKAKTANEYIYEQFKDWYLWYDQIPDIDPNGIATQEALIDSIKNPVDRWSFSGSLTAVSNLFQSGEYKGFGGGFMLDADNVIKISQVYTQSPLGRSGVERGWKVVTINGYSSEDIDSINAALASDDVVNFVFSDLDNVQHSFSLQHEAITMNTVLYSNVYSVEDKKIGYVVFDGFYSSSVAELNTAVEKFKTENITDLIVDLRYNGGGLNDVAYKLFAMIGGSKVKGQKISELKHNDKHSSKDQVQLSEYDGSVLNVSSVCFITTKQTASASELVINSLEPYMDVKLIGSSTHGKPVGMYIFSVKALDLAILPISFKNINSLGYGDYYDGLPVDVTEIDDLSHGWGDTDELMLKAAISVVAEPTLTLNRSELKSCRAGLQKPLEYKGIYNLIQAY